MTGRNLLARHGARLLTLPRETMKRPLRQILADSDIAAVTIAVLLLWSLDGTFRALWGPVSRAVGFLFTAVAIFDIPYFSPTLTLADRFMFVTATYLYGAVVSFTAAWLLSRGLRCRAAATARTPSGGN